MARKKAETQQISNMDAIRNAPSFEIKEKIDLNSIKEEKENTISEENTKKQPKKLDKNDSNIVKYNQEDLFSDDNDDFLDDRMLSMKNKLKDLESSKSVLDDEDENEESEDLDEEEVIEEEVDNKENKNESKSEEELSKKAQKKKALEEKERELEERNRELQQKMELLLKFQQEMLKNQEPKKEEVKTPSKKELKQKEILDKKAKIRSLYEKVLNGDDTLLDELVEMQTSLIEIPEEKEEVNIDNIVNQKLSYQLELMKEEQIKEKFANDNKDLLDNEDYRDFLISKFNKLKESGADSTLDGLLRLSADATRKAFKIEKVNRDTESKEQESIKQELEKKEKAKKLSVKSTALGVNSVKNTQEDEEESLLDMYRKFRL